MAKCASCGVINPDTASFCSNCGKPIDKTAPSPDEAALISARKEFEKDALAGIDKSRITYVCELCGTINRIDSPRCVRCGKPRPRGEFIAALKKIKESAVYNEETSVAEKAEEIKESAPAPVQQAQAQPQIQQPQPEPAPESKLKLYRLEEEPARNQSPQMIQPFVIVPYVDTMQKVWQYNPRQIYKFQPFSYEEKLNKEEKAAEYTSGAAPTVEELLALREKKQNELSRIDGDLKSLTEQKEDTTVYNKKGGRVRAAAVLSLLFSAALLAVMYLLPLAKGYAGIEVFKSLANCLNGAFGVNLGISAQGFVYDGWASFLAPVSYILITIFAIIILIRSIVRLISGYAKTKGVVLSVLIFVLSLIAAVGIILTSSYGFGDIAGFFKNASYGLYAVIGTSLVLFLLSFAGIKNTKAK